jgi:hypothetical protein
MAEANHAAATLAIDGDPSDWQSAKRYPIKNLTAGTATDGTNFSGQFAVQWDETFFYVLIEITDNVIKVDGSVNDPWNDDTVEMFLDVDPSSTKQAYDPAVDQIFVTANGNILEHPAHKRGWKAQATLLKPTGGWRAEVAIEWPLGTPTPNSVLGLDVAIDDDDAAGGDLIRERQLTWNDTTGNDFQNPGLFGLVRLLPP